MCNDVDIPASLSTTLFKQCFKKQSDFILLQVPFRDEAQLFLSVNTTGCYLVECVMRGIISNQEDMAAHVDAYMEKHMFTEATLGQVR